MTDTNKFAVLTNAGDWQQYRTNIVTSVLGGEGPDLFELDSVMNFPAAPQHYPCLVASLIVMLEGVEYDSGKYQVNCCYVYPEDAQKLLEVATPKKKAAKKPKVFADAATSAGEVDSQHGLQLSAVLLALIVELESLGAIKPKRLLSEVKKLHKSLDGREVHDFLFLLSETLEGRNAD